MGAQSGGSRDISRALTTVDGMEEVGIATAGDPRECARYRADHLDRRFQRRSKRGN